MKIEDNRKKDEMVEFGQLNSGEPFILDDVCYMRISQKCDNAISLRSGILTSFSDLTKVKRCKAKVVIET